MRSLALFLWVAVAITLSVCSSFIGVRGLVPSEFSFSNCNADISIDTDGWYQKVTLRFGSAGYVTTLAAGATFVRHQCGIAFPITSPTGQRMTMRDISWSGSSSAIPPKVQATLTCDYFLGANGKSDRTVRTLNTSTFTEAHVVQNTADMMAICSNQTEIRVNLGLIVRASDAPTDDVQFQLSELTYAFGPVDCGIASGNPCEAQNNGCSADATCSLAVGVPVVCTCRAGFSGDGHTCVPNDPCANNGGCSANATCSVSSGGAAVCTCNDGFVGDGHTCVLPPIRVGKLTVSGTGCPNGDVALVKTAQADMVTLQLQLGSPVTSPTTSTTTVAQRTCTFAIPVKLQSGRAYALLNATYPVDVTAPDAAVGTLSADYFFAGQTATSARGFPFPGPRVQQDVRVIDRTPSPAFQPDGTTPYADAIVRLSLVVKMSKKTSDTGFIAVGTSAPVLLTLGAVASTNPCDQSHGGCSADATCSVNSGGAPVCTCNAGFTGDGRTCERLALIQLGPVTSGSDCPTATAALVKTTEFETVKLQLQLGSDMSTSPTSTMANSFSFCHYEVAVQLLMGRAYSLLSATYPVRVHAPVTAATGRLGSNYYFVGQTGSQRWINFPGVLNHADSEAVDSTAMPAFAPAGNGTYADAIVHLYMIAVMKNSEQATAPGYTAVTAAKPIEITIRSPTSTAARLGAGTEDQPGGSPNSSGPLATWMIAAIAGGGALVFIVIGLVWACIRSKRRQAARAISALSSNTVELQSPMSTSTV